MLAVPLFGPRVRECPGSVGQGCQSGLQRSFIIAGHQQQLAVLRSKVGRGPGGRRHGLVQG